MSKTCTMCKRELPEEMFHRDRTKADGHRANCKDCHAKVRSAQDIGSSSAAADTGSAWQDRDRRMAQQVEVVTVPTMGEAIKRELDPVGVPPAGRKPNLTKMLTATSIALQMITECDICCEALQEPAKLCIRSGAVRAAVCTKCHSILEMNPSSKRLQNIIRFLESLEEEPLREGKLDVEDIINALT